MRGPDMPGDDPVFHAPWQARLFAVTVALADRGIFTWPDWTAALAASLASRDDPPDPDPARQAEAYYRAWSDALTTLLEARGAAAPEEIRATAASWRRAAEATPHGHPIRLPPR